MYDTKREESITVTRAKSTENQAKRARICLPSKIVLIITVKNHRADPDIVQNDVNVPAVVVPSIRAVGVEQPVVFWLRGLGRPRARVGVAESLKQATISFIRVKLDVVDDVGRPLAVSIIKIECEDDVVLKATMKAHTG